MTEDARPWALRFCVDPSGLLVGGWLDNDLDVWCRFCCWLIASKCLELCDANVIMASRGNGNPFFLAYVLQVCSKKVLLIGLETHAGGSFLLDELQYLPVIIKQIMLTI